MCSTVAADTHLGTPHIHTEEELIKMLRLKTKEAFDQLYQQYAAVLYGVILRVLGDEHTSQDVLQEAFIKIWQRIDQYDPAKGRLYTWMLNIARNAAVDKLRSKGEIMKTKIHTGEDIVYNETMAGSTGQSTDTIGLRKLVAELKPEHGTVVQMAYFNGYSMEEIAKTLEIPVGTVKTRMRSAIKQLKGIFGK